MHGMHYLHNIEMYRHILAYTYTCVYICLYYAYTTHIRILIYTLLIYRCQFRELDSITNQLFASCLPTIPLIILTFPTHDDLIQECILLLCDIAEVQLSGMEGNSAIILYKTVLYTFNLISTRLQQVQPIINSGAFNSVRSELGQFEEEYKNNILYIILSLLNHLVTKDLQLSITDSESPLQSYSSTNRHPLTSSSFTSPTSKLSSNIHHMKLNNNVNTLNLIPIVLLQGLYMVISVLTPDILKQFPATADRYFRLVVYCTVYCVV